MPGAVFQGRSSDAGQGIEGAVMILDFCVEREPVWTSLFRRVVVCGGIDGTSWESPRGSTRADQH